MGGETDKDDEEKEGHGNHLQKKRCQESGSKSYMMAKEEGDEHKQGEGHVARHGNLVWKLLLLLRHLFAAAVVGKGNVTPLVIPEVGDCDEHCVGEEDGKAGVVEDKVDSTASILGFSRFFHCGEGAVVCLHSPWIVLCRLCSEVSSAVTVSPISMSALTSVLRISGRASWHS